MLWAFVFSDNGKISGTYWWYFTDYIKLKLLFSMLLKRDIYNLSKVSIYMPLNQLLGKRTRFVLIKNFGDNMLSPTLQQALQIFFVTEIFWEFGIYTPTHHLCTMIPVPENDLLLPDVQVLHKHCHILPNRNT